MAGEDNKLITLANLAEFKTKLYSDLKTINGSSITGGGFIISRC